MTAWADSKPPVTNLLQPAPPNRALIGVARPLGVPMSNPSPSGFGRVLLAAATCALLALPAFAGSQARIVRLSDVQGSVQIDKNTGLGFESAFLNLPITQGAHIRTHDRGRAEIEFEDGSTLRLTPNTTVEFSTLGLRDSAKRT